MHRHHFLLIGAIVWSFTSCLPVPEEHGADSGPDETGVTDVGAHDSDSTSDTSPPGRDSGAQDDGVRDAASLEDAPGVPDATGMHDATGVQDATDARDEDDARPSFCASLEDGTYCHDSDVVLCADYVEQSREACDHGCDSTIGDCKPVACGALTTLDDCDDGSLDPTNRCAFFLNANHCLPNGLDPDSVGECFANTTRTSCLGETACHWYDCVSKCLLNGIDSEDVCPPTDR